MGIGFLLGFFFVGFFYDNTTLHGKTDVSGLLVLQCRVLGELNI